MKRIRINTGNIGLVFRKGDFKRVITQGVYWLGFGERVQVYNLAQEFIPTKTLAIFEADEGFRSMTHRIEVADNELLLIYKNGLFFDVRPAGQYVFWNSLVEYSFIKADLSKIDITEAIDKTLFGHIKLRNYIRLFEVSAYEKAVLLVDDVYVKTLESGTYRFWRNDISVKIAKVDMRQLQLEIAGQELLTKDKAGIRINFYTSYKVTDVETALLDSKDYEKQLYTALQLALRSYVGEYTLDELLERKADIAKAVLAETKVEAEKLGVSILNAGMRDVILTGEMKAIMNQVLIAQKTAQANVIKRREENASTRSLLNTAKLMDDNAMLYKLKEMEYVEKIAERIGEITVSGNGGMVSQLKDIFAVSK